MNYKQKYNEALERAKAWVENRCMPSDINRQGVLEDIFPELKESEDEKIRKVIIGLLKQSTYEDCDYDGMSMKDIYAWIEKQGKQEQIIDYPDSLPKDNWELVHEFVEKFGRIPKDEDELNALVEYILKRQKPAWSEEDERNLNDAILFVETGTYSLDKDKLINWLKSLRPQNITVTDEELAQAKKDAYNDALDKIEYHSGEPTFDDGWSAAIWYLKKRNAQPQNTWKPSDEQMKALDAARHSNSFNVRILDTLFHDLKKLREE